MKLNVCIVREGCACFGVRDITILVNGVGLRKSEKIRLIFKIKHFTIISRIVRQNFQIIIVRFGQNFFVWRIH